jgi:hypothetical protein
MGAHALRKESYMTRNIWRHVSWPVVFAGLTAPFVANCGGSMPGMPGGGGGLPGVGNPAGNCPDMAKAEAIESFDFEKEFKLKADVAAKIKGGVGAASEMNAFAAKVDADLKDACGLLAHDLGATGDFKDGQEACKAAAKAIGDTKAKLGANLKVTLDVSEPHCGADIKVYGDCAAHCDASVTPGKVDVKCEPGKLQGECDAKCSGSCEASAAAACTGECSGTCDAEIKGACSGKCTGKCDGKAMPASANGQCSGTCSGKCDGNVQGECKGKCGGDCKLSGDAQCSGTCTGGCSAEMKAPKCTGHVEPPQMSAECKAKCDAHVEAKVECTPPHVVVRLAGAADAKLAESFRATMEKDMGPVLKIALGMGKHAEHLAGEVSTVVQGAQAAVQSAGDPMTTARLAACVSAPFKGALDAAASLKSSVSVSVNVQASVTASGSAGASGKSG